MSSLLSSSDWLFTPDYMHYTPSSSKYTLQEEIKARAEGIDFITTLADTLRCPQIIVASASVYFHRFYMRHSLADYHQFTVGATCLYLACKLEDDYRHMQDVIILAIKVSQNNPGLEVNLNHKDYSKWEYYITHNEHLVCRALCFDFDVVHPYAHIVQLSNILSCPKNIVEYSWALINDRYKKDELAKTTGK